jgi:hypothetical protein
MMPPESHSLKIVGASCVGGCGVRIRLSGDIYEVHVVVVVGSNGTNSSGLGHSGLAW